MGAVASRDPLIATASAFPDPSAQHFLGSPEQACCQIPDTNAQVAQDATALPYGLLGRPWRQRRSQRTPPSGAVNHGVVSTGLNPDREDFARLTAPLPVTGCGLRFPGLACFRGLLMARRSNSMFLVRKGFTDRNLAEGRPVPDAYVPRQELQRLHHQ